MLIVTPARKRRILRCVLPEQEDNVLARLKKLSDQLDTAKKSAEITAREIARARENTAATKKAVRLHRTAQSATKERRTGTKRRKR